MQNCLIHLSGYCKPIYYMHVQVVFMNRYCNMKKIVVHMPVHANQTMQGEGAPVDNPPYSGIFNEVEFNEVE